MWSLYISDISSLTTFSILFILYFCTCYCLRTQQLTTKTCIMYPKLTIKDHFWVILLQEKYISQVGRALPDRWQSSSEITGGQRSHSSSNSALYLRTYFFARNFNWLRLAKCLFFVMVLSSTVFSCNRFDGAAEAKESLQVAKGGHEEPAKKRWSGSWSSNIGVVSKFSGFPDHISSSFFL